jgi:hypothetical protein
MSPLRLLPAVALLAFSSANAATVLTYNGVAGSSANTGNNTIGAKFTVNTTGLSITHLGVQDVNIGTAGAGTDGFTATIPVSIWSGDGLTLLATANVTGTETIIDSYRYVELSTPLALISGNSYLIGAYMGGGGERWIEGFPGSRFASGSGDLTLNSSNFANGNAAPTSVGGTGALIGRWGAANALVIPEPSAALLGGIGLLSLMRRRRER